jgi:hypothetical protein
MTELSGFKHRLVTYGAPDETTFGRLFVLDVSGGRVLSVNPDGSGRKVLVTGCRNPGGLVVDALAGHIYWTNMGVANVNDGSIERADLDGQNRKTIVPVGGTFTPMRIHLDMKSGRLYWSDREGMRVMSSSLDGSMLETLVETGHGDADRRDAGRWCVGITVDAERGHIYWTQKGPDDAQEGRICRASLGLPKGRSAGNRTDVEVLIDGLPEPIDVELDRKKRLIYWTDRGGAPRGNTVKRAPIDTSAGKRQAPEVLLSHPMEGIGLALDLKAERMFLTVAGSVYSARLNRPEKKVLLHSEGNLAGLAYAEVPAKFA